MSHPTLSPGLHEIRVLNINTVSEGKRWLDSKCTIFSGTTQFRWILNTQDSVANIYFIFITHPTHHAFWNLWIAPDAFSHCKCKISNSAHHHIITSKDFCKCGQRVFTKINATHLITDIVNVPLWRGFLLFLSKKDPGIHVFRISVACNNRWNTK